MTTRRATATNEKTLTAFVAAKAEIDARLERLKGLSDDHFHANPDEIPWAISAICSATQVCCAS